MSNKGPSVLYLDLETAPHLVMAWGLFNQTIRINQIREPGFTLCWAASWGPSKGVEFRSRHDPDFLDKLWELLDEADVVCSYNGNRFDIPVVNREFLENGYTPPSPYKSLDLYLTVRRHFRFASNKLDFVCQSLGIGAKTQHKGQELWTGCMEDDEASWRKMEQYNKQDVRLLPKLYKKLLPWIKDHPNYGLYTDPTRPTCTNCGGPVQSRGVEHTKTQSYRRYQCTKCGAWNRGRYNITTENQKANTLTHV